ncbi:MAG: YcaO-like family protein [Bdellovibrionales bacterium]|nr:YcaO-like family protein [Bdellovibrionales bacterium]
MVGLARDNLDLFLWIQRNRRRLDLCITENLPYSRLIGAPAYSVMMKVGRFIQAGYGYDPSPMISLNKAFSEVVERQYYVHQGGLSTSGYATHFVPEAAQTAARLELIERDAFLTHFLTETAFSEIANNEVFCPAIDWDGIRKRLRKKGCSISLYRMNSDFQVHAVLAIVRGDQNVVPFGMKIAASVSTQSLDAAAQSAILESTACASGIIFAPRGLSLKAPINAFRFRILSQGRGIPSVHTSAACHFKYSREFKNVYLKGPKKPWPLGTRPIDQVQVVRVKPKIPVLASIPLICYRATDPKLQHLFFGVAKPSYFNHERLKRMGGMKTQSGFPSKNPHPFP